MSSYVPALDTWLLQRELPQGVNGFITRDGDDTTYIVIDKDLSETKKLNTLTHEFVHLVRGDLDSDEKREDIEYKARVIRGILCHSI